MSAKSMSFSNGEGPLEKTSETNVTSFRAFLMSLSSQKRVTPCYVYVYVNVYTLFLSRKNYQDEARNVTDRNALPFLERLKTPGIGFPVRYKLSHSRNGGSATLALAAGKLRAVEHSTMNRTLDGKPIPTQRDVAKKADVSVATVSRFINQKGYISPPISKRIDSAIQELRYKPNLLARSLKVRSSKIIGLIFPDIENPFFITLVETAEEVAREHGYNVILCNTKNRQEDEIGHLEVLKGKQADGYIIIPSITSGSSLPELLKGEKVVLLDRTIESDAEHVVVKLDNAKGVKLAIDHLAKLGHTRIGTVLVPTNVTTGWERMVGYRNALRENGLAYDESLVGQADFSVESACEQTRKLLALPNRPTALLPMSGPTTLGAIKAIKESGLRVPDELSFIGFDEFAYAGLLSPSLTTIAQPARDFGTIGIQILLKLLQGEEPEPKMIVLDPILIMRDSCRRIG